MAEDSDHRPEPTWTLAELLVAFNGWPKPVGIEVELLRSPLDGRYIVSLEAASGCKVLIGVDPVSLEGLSEALDFEVCMMYRDHMYCTNHCRDRDLKWRGRHFSRWAERYAESWRAVMMVRRAQGRYSSRPGIAGSWRKRREAR